MREEVAVCAFVRTGKRQTTCRMPKKSRRSGGSVKTSRAVAGEKEKQARKDGVTINKTSRTSQEHA